MEAKNIDNSKKYLLDKIDSIAFDGHTLYRIVALKDFADVKAGDKGGYVESEDNLSQDGNSWVYHRAKVWNAARISDDAQVFGQAEVYDNAQVGGTSWIYGNAKVYGDAQVLGESYIYDNAQVFGQAEVYDNAQVGGTSWVYGNAKVYGDAQVGGNAQVSGNAKVYGFTQVGGNASISGDGELNVNDTITEDVVLNSDRNNSASESESLSVEENRRKGLGI